MRKVCAPRRHGAAAGRTPLALESRGRTRVAPPDTHALTPIGYRVSDFSGLEPDVIRQIAQVYVDLMSISEDSLSDDALASALELASRRAVDLGAIEIHEDGDVVTVNPTNLVAGGMRAMHALTRMLEERTPLTHEALLAEWRSTLDSDDEPV